MSAPEGFGHEVAPLGSTLSDGAAERLPADAARILGEVQGLIEAGKVGDVSDEAAQDLLLAAVRLFSAKRDQGAAFPAFAADAVTATDVAITCVAMTEVVNLELFELALWHGWSNV